MSNLSATNSAAALRPGRTDGIQTGRSFAPQRELVLKATALFLVCAT